MTSDINWSLIEHIKQTATSLAAGIKALKAELAEAQRERDEARAKCAEMLGVLPHLNDCLYEEICAAHQDGEGDEIPTAEALHARTAEILASPNLGQTFLDRLHRVEGALQEMLTNELCSCRAIPCNRCRVAIDEAKQALDKEEPHANNRPGKG